MENFENDHTENKQTENPDSTEFAAETEQSRPKASCETQAQPSWSTNGIPGGETRKESPFANSPYVAYHNAQTQGAYYQVPPQPAEPSKSGKTGKRVLAGVLTVLLVIGACGFTAVGINYYWKDQNQKQSMYFNEKLQILQDQIDAGKHSADNQPVIPTEGMTPSQIYEKNVKSVVAITSITTASSMGQMVEARATGSGFVLTEDGYVVTNYHVIAGSSKVTVTTSDGSVYDAKIVGHLSTNDVALLKVEAAGLQPVAIGHSDELAVGSQVVAIGNPLGELTSTLTVGYVSGMNRDITTDGNVINMIQTDAVINPGNSGGPLFNAKGEVVGITTAKYSGTTESGAVIEGISFAVPIDDVIGVLVDLKDHGYITGVLLGVKVKNVDKKVAEAYGLPQGAYVAEVTRGSCAETAGIRDKDIITAVGGYDVKNLNDLTLALRKFKAGDTATVKVWRAGQEVLLTIVFDAKPLPAK